MDSKSGAFQRKGLSLRSTLSCHSISYGKPFWGSLLSTADLHSCIDS